MDSDNNKPTDNKIVWKQAQDASDETSTSTPSTASGTSASAGSSSNKIVWKRTQEGNKNPVNLNTAARNDSFGNDEVYQSPSVKPQTVNEDVSAVDLSARAAQYNANSNIQPTVPKESIDDLKAEINRAFSADEGSMTQPSTIEPTLEGESQPETMKDFSKSQDAQYASSDIDDVARQNHETLMASLKNDIQNDFEKTPDTDTAKKAAVQSIDKTYYSDLTQAMKSNEPATMSELIQKSRFEEKERNILSPRSRKNMLFIIGGLIFLVASIIILFAIFKGEEKVEFITEQRVDSLIYSNLDTGINITGIEASRTKQAIRKVIETKIPKDSVNQIYYIRENGVGGVERLGIKDIFEKTESKTPKLLYDNIENNFMHGVYKAEKNHPFLVLKATSYDRAFQGMKEWEPTMIDDLATYLNLPDEASNRSLTEDGFEYDLIKNKNVRVARFLPRDSDRKGILDFLKFGSGDEEQTEGESENTAVPLGETIEDNGNVSFQMRIHDAFALVTPHYAQAQDNVFTKLKKCYNPDFPGQVFPASYEGQTGYSCVVSGTESAAIGQGDAISQITRTADVCFDPVYGKRLTEEEQTIIGGGAGSPYGFCFPSYQCKRTACFMDSVEVNASREGQPGVFCGKETTEIVDIDKNVPKLCRQFNDLIRMDNLNSSLLCFNQYGQYLPNYTQSNSSQGVTCIAPLSRGVRMCVQKQTGIIFNPDAPNAPGEETAQFCFEPIKGRLTDLDTNKKCSNLTTLEIQQRLAQAGYELHQIAGILALIDKLPLINIGSNDIQNIREAGSLLIRLSRQNVLQIEEVRQITAMLQRLEQVLNKIDPNFELPTTGPNGGMNIYGFLRRLIDTVKCTLGIADTLQWITLEQIPQGMIIYSGQTLPQVTPIQQSLVLLGLMDPISVTGTLDLVTQDAISQFQLANGLDPTGIIDTKTAIFINTIIQNQAALYPDGVLESNEAIVNDYFIVSNAPIDQNGNPIDSNIPLHPNGNPIGTAIILDSNGNPVGTGIMLDANGNPIETEIIVIGTVLDANGNPVGTGIMLDASGNPIVAGTIVSGTVLDANGIPVGTVFDADGNPINGTIVAGTVLDSNGNPISGTIFSGPALGADGNPIGGTTISGAVLDANGNPVSGTVFPGTILDANGNPIGAAMGGSGSVLATGLGTYSNSVQNLQIILYGEGYDVPGINGLFDQATCDAVRAYQDDNDLEQSDPAECIVGEETFNSLNGLIREKNYLGSGFKANPQGYLEGVGTLKNTFGPGTVDYLVNPAEADVLKEGDIVLMYVFLDEETILIARDQIVIEEVIKRRALKDIF